MSAREQLAALVAAAPAGLVLPGGDRRALVDVAAPLRLLAALELGAGRWVGVVADSDDDRWTVPLVADADGVRRAVPGDGVAEALVRRLGSGSIDSFATEQWHAEDVTGERAVTVDQTNESVVVGERAVVKWCVRLPDAGLPAQPAAQRLRTLGAQGFTQTPSPWGMLTWSDEEDGRTFLLATVAELLAGAQDGWDWAVDDVRRLARGEISQQEAVEPARALGGLTARLHAALASTGRDVADDRTVAGWVARAYDDLDAAVQLVDGPEGARLHARAGRIAVALGALRDCVGTPLIDVHGDLHVGQVLRYGDPAAYAVTDFDGNPVLAPEHRSDRQPAALDVAGMLASLDHVGRVVLKRTEGVDAAVVTAWIEAAQAAYLEAYRATLAELGHADLLDERLLAPLRLQQECREFLYAVRHLPHWRYVPDAALCDLLPDEE